MKSLLLCVGLSLSILLANGQQNDVVTLKDGLEVKGKIIQVTESAIEIDPEGEVPFQILKRANVALITYANGTQIRLAAVESNAPAQSLTINKRSNNPLDKLFGNSSSKRFTSAVVEVSDETDKATEIEAKYSFNDKQGQYREIRLVYQRQKGFYHYMKAELYIDNQLVETRDGGSGEEKYKKDWQWINTTIPNERILVTTDLIGTRFSSNGTMLTFRLMAALDRLDGPVNDTEETQKLKTAIATVGNSAVLIEESIKESDIIGTMKFLKSETFFQGKDGVIHQLRIESDYVVPVLSARVFIDNKLIKEGSSDAKKNATVPLLVHTESGDQLEITVKHEGGGAGRPRNLYAKLL
jgi:hypothetical protein